jgi:rhodanese-related sulfurtransferase
MTLPPATIVYPAHGAGSMCGKALSVERSSTIGRQLEENGALQPMTQGEFVAMVTADQPPAPAYFGFDAGLNRMERPTLETAMMGAKKPLLRDKFLELQLQGAQVLDVREPEAFAAGHLPGAINIPLTSRFASWAGTLLDRERPVILVTEIGDEGDGILRLGRIGYDIVIGYLAFTSAWEAPRTPLTTVARVTPDEFRSQREGDESTLVLDVRTCAEHAADKIEGSLSIPLGELRSRLDEVPTDRDLVLLCKTGERSSMGISILQGEGFTRLTDMIGGFDAWTGADPEAAPTCQLS